MIRGKDKKPRQNSEKIYPAKGDHYEAEAGLPQRKLCWNLQLEADTDLRGSRLTGGLPGL